MKSARGARFTRSGGRGECHRLGLTGKVDQNSLFAILACPSANRRHFAGNRQLLGKNAGRKQLRRLSLSNLQRLLLRGPERRQFDSLGHRYSA